VDGTPFTASEARFVERQRVAHLATLLADGTTPHVVPVSPVLDLNRLVFASETQTQKISNIRGNPAVALCFDEYSEVWASLKQVLVYGQAYFIESGFEFTRDRDLLYRKYAQYEIDSPIEDSDSIMVEIRIERVSSWGLGGS
jgi:nitroimidazol reductase NimA-like FMN-containing flavoprotein (pyridoxamine 5'-phosphate oxidase superfamily)